MESPINWREIFYYVVKHYLMVKHLQCHWTYLMVDSASFVHVNVLCIGEDHPIQCIINQGHPCIIVFTSFIVLSYINKCNQICLVILATYHLLYMVYLMSWTYHWPITMYRISAIQLVNVTAVKMTVQKISILSSCNY